MVDCVGGFPHSNVVSCIGGFLSECAAEAPLGSLNLETILPFWELIGIPNPYGYDEIWKVNFTGNMSWNLMLAPPQGFSALEFDFTPDNARVNDGAPPDDFGWYRIWSYMPETPTPWVVAGGVEYGMVNLYRKDTGDFVFMLYDLAQGTALDDAIALFPDGVDTVEAMVDAAVAAGVAIRCPAAIMLDQYRYGIHVSFSRIDDAATIGVQISVAPPFEAGEDITVAGTWGTTTVTGITEFGGFFGTGDWMMWPVFRGHLGQPRLVGCEIADPLPEPFTLVDELDTPSECDSLLGAPGDPYGGNFLATFKVSVPVGVQSDSYSIEIASVCDKPMTLAGIEWSGWLFNNSRRI